MSEQGLRYNDNKPKLSFVAEFPNALVGVTRVLEFGAQKYARSNWQKGLPFTEVLDSMMRHQIAWTNGEDLDPESGLSHLDHILCNALFLSELSRTKPDFDDRTGG
jgi:hypothetical protein